jgi:hypothetical protein
VNRYAFTGWTRYVTINHLTIQHFGTNGRTTARAAVNHDSATGWRIIRDTIRRNGGAWVFMGTAVTCKATAWLTRGSTGSKGSTRGTASWAHHEITGNTTANWVRLRPGWACTGGGMFWNARNVALRANHVHDNRGVGLWADTNNAGSLNNSSLRSAPWVNREVANLRTCVASTIGTSPYYDDCRGRPSARGWRTTPREPPLGHPRLPSSDELWFPGAVLELGTSPDWSPYQGPVVERQITWRQATSGRTTGTSAIGTSW